MEEYTFVGELQEMMRMLRSMEDRLRRIEARIEEGRTEQPRESPPPVMPELEEMRERLAKIEMMVSMGSVGLDPIMAQTSTIRDAIAGLSETVAELGNLIRETVLKFSDCRNVMDTLILEKLLDLEQKVEKLRGPL